MAAQPKTPYTKDCCWRLASVYGQGVFAAVDLKKGEVIERCPYLVIDDDDLAEEKTGLMTISLPALT